MLPCGCSKTDEVGLRVAIDEEAFIPAVERWVFIVLQFTTISPHCSAEFGKRWSVFGFANLSTSNVARRANLTGRKKAQKAQKGNRCSSFA